MKLYHNEDIGIERYHTCCSLDDVEDARSVAYKLGIPFYVFNFTDAFRDTVIRKFIESYENGITPNPCIDCNRYMKFDKLFERAKILGCDYMRQRTKRHKMYACIHFCVYEGRKTPRSSHFSKKNERIRGVFRIA